MLRLLKGDYGDADNENERAPQCSVNQLSLPPPILPASLFQSLTVIFRVHVLSRYALKKDEQYSHRLTPHPCRPRSVPEYHFALGSALRHVQECISVLCWTASGNDRVMPVGLC